MTYRRSTSAGARPHGSASGGRGIRRTTVTIFATAAIIASTLPVAPWAAAAGNQAVQIDGVTGHGITLGTAGTASPLGASQFTLELWFQRTGAGVGVSTGSGGITNAIPLITKGRSEGDGSNIDTNYFLGIDATTGRLGADYEEGAGQTTPGLNHPVNGATTVTQNVWHHAAATFNGSQFCLYLDGVLDGTCTATTQLPRSDSIQAPAIGTSSQSTPGTLAGAFLGQVDEARIWNVARSQAQIQGSMNSELTSGTGLLGRWGMNEGSGTTTAGSVGGINGTLTAGTSWVAGAPALGGPPPPSGSFGVQIDGVTGHGITLGTAGTASPLGASQFTLELWFQRTGAGVGVSTGSGGITNAIPLITKGRSETDGSNVDTNYFLGIDATTGRLAADYEEGAGQTTPGLNHPVNGATTVTQNVWHHAAATFNGSQFCLYLDGVLDGTCTATTQLPRSDSIQAPAIGTSSQSTPGTLAGSFQGQVDEVRIWNNARSQAQIQGSMNSELTSGTGLLGRWGMNEGSGTTTAGSVGGINGSLTAGASWVVGAPALGSPPPPSGNQAVQIDGVTGHGITLGTAGTASPLGASQFTLELWFQRTGAGVGVSTGSGGITNAIPLITKGRSENDGSNIDTNYFLGIDATTGRLGADYEEGAGQASPGLNHPVNGATTVTQNVWHHAAATFNGSQFCLYLDGVLDGTCTATTQLPRSDSIQAPAIGTSSQSTPNTLAGSFQGQVDEVRIWNVARSQAQIQGSMNSELTSGTGLLGRWGLNEGSGTTTAGSVGGINGTLTAGTSWVAGAPFTPPGDAPDAPVLVAPNDGATGVVRPPTLDVTVTDPDSSDLDVTFYGRPATGQAGQDFTLMTIPDTQYYSETAALSPIFGAQTQWIVDTQAQLNTAFTTHLGDITQNYDTIEVEWQRASAHMATLDNNGVKNGVSPGNHDFNGSNAAYYDQYFPPSRYQSFPWYGGYLGGSPSDTVNRQNKDNYELFSAGGMDFLIIHLEYDMPLYAVQWAQGIIDQFPTREVILSTHAFINTSAARPTSPVSRADGMSAQAVWTQLVAPNCNIFMVVNGHYHGEARRTDNNSCGEPVHQLVSDYQEYQNGGDGYLRYYTFKPSEDKIYAYTYSPTRNGGNGQFETDANSQFSFDWNMPGAGQFTEIGSQNDVASGGHATMTWNGLDPGTEYEWYATVTDGSQTTDSDEWSFTTSVPPPAPPVVDSVTINQSGPRTNDTLSVTVAAHDDNNDPLTYAYQWTRNGTDIAGATNQNLNLANSGNGDKGDLIRVRVTANDGSANSAPVTSAAVTIQNTAPAATVALSPSTPRSTDVVTATATRSDDDVEPVTLTYVWKVNDVVRKTTATSSNLTDTLDLSTLSVVNGDVVKVEVTPSDGTASGTLVSASVTVDTPTVSEIPDSTFQVNGRVNALLRVGNRIYIGGDFTQLLGHNGEIVPRQYLAALDATTGQPVAWDPGADGIVYSLAASPDGTRIYAGGGFQHVSTLTRTRLAAIDATTGAVQSWNPSASAIVRSIVPSGNTVYVAGNFTFISSQSRTRFAAIDATTGAVSTTWMPTASGGNPQKMVMTPDGRLIVVGTFTTINGASSPYLASLNATTGASLPWANRPATPTEGISQGGGRLFVGTGNGAGGNQVVAYDLATGAQQWVRTGDGDVVAVQYLDGTLYAGGHFDSMNGQPRGRLAAFDPATGTLRAWNASVNTTVAIVTMTGGASKLYIGGAFTIVSGVNQQRFAAFSGAPAPNTPPVVDSVVIDQTAPGTNATLTATITAHDGESNPLTYTYQWTRNGADIAGATSATLDMSVAGRGDRGDQIRLRVIANDGTASSGAVTSSPVTVVNTAPTATVTLDNDQPGTSAVITATATRADADADAVSLTYLWTVNGVTRQTVTTTNLTDTFDLSVAGNGDPGDTIVVTVTPNDGTANGTAATDTATVGSGATPPILSDGFASGNFTNWSSNTRLTIDNAVGSPVPSARAQVSAQSAFAYRDLGSTYSQVCLSMDVNLASGSGNDLFRLRSAGSGPIIKVAVTSTGTLQLRSDFSAATLNTGVALGSGWHNIELCGTVGSTSTWDLYRDGVRIVNAWQANTGTLPVSRIQIGDTAAKTFTLNMDNIVLDQAVGQGGAQDTTPPTTPGQPSGTSPAAGSIDISWAASTDASQPITYRIYRDGGATSVGSTTTTSFTDTGLTPGSSHTYTVDAVDAATNVSAMSPASASITVTTGSPAIFSDDFSSGNFSNWTSNTRLTIDNAIGSPAPSARAQVSAQSAFAFRDLSSTYTQVCLSMDVNLASGSGFDLFRLRTAANGAIIKAFVAANGTLQLRSDFASTTFNSNVALGTGWHTIELCGTVGAATTWDLYRDGVRIVNAWQANTGTTPVGRVQIGDNAAKTFTANFDDVVLDQAAG